MGHYAAKIGHNFTSFRIVAAHAAQPQAVFLGAVEDRKLLFVDKFLALSGGEAEGVAVAFQVEEELGAVVVFPLAGVDCATSEADDDRQMLDTDGALEFAGSAGGALEGCFLRVVFAE